MAHSRGITPSTASCPRLSPRIPGFPSAPPAASPRGLRHHVHACTLRDGAKPQSSPHRSVEQWARAEDGAMERPSGRRGPLPAGSREHPHPCRAPARSPEASPPAPNSAPPWEQPPAPHGQEHTDTWGSKTRRSLTGTVQGLREPAPTDDPRPRAPTGLKQQLRPPRRWDPRTHTRTPGRRGQTVTTKGCLGGDTGQRAGLLNSGVGQAQTGPLLPRDQVHPKAYRRTRPCTPPPWPSPAPGPQARPRPPAGPSRLGAPRRPLGCQARLGAALALGWRAPCPAPAPRCPSSSDSAGRGCWSGEGRVSASREKAQVTRPDARASDAPTGLPGGHLPPATHKTKRTRDTAPTRMLPVPRK